MAKTKTPRAAISQDGYGLFYVNDEIGYMLAHEFAYLLYKGAIPEGHVVRQTCGQKLCVAPDHLELVPKVEG